LEDDYDDDDDGSSSGDSDNGEYRDEDKDVTVLTTVEIVVEKKGNLSVQCHLLIIY
jgi:hypothetical protein